MKVKALIFGRLMVHYGLGPVAFSLWLGMAANAGAQSVETGGIGGSGVSVEAGGIGGTGGPARAKTGAAVIGYGPIQAFGSIFVNNREYAVNAHTLVTIDGAPATVAALRIGDVTEVKGSITGAARGLAQTVSVIHPVMGQVQAVSGNGAEIMVLGQRVVSAPGQVLFKTIMPGDEIAVSAQLRPDGVWVARNFAVPPGAQVQLAARMVGDGLVGLAGLPPRIDAPHTLLAGLAQGQSVIVSATLVAGQLHATALAPYGLSVSTPGMAVEVEDYFTSSPGGTLCAPDGIKADNAPANIVLHGQRPVEVNGFAGAGAAISVEAVVPEVAEPGEGAEVPAHMPVQHSAATFPAVSVEGKPAAGIDKATLPEMAEPQKAGVVPDIDPQDFHPELPDLEMPEIHEPPDD